MVTRRLWIKQGVAACLAYPPANELLRQINFIPVQKRLIPVSKESIPVIGLGTWQTFDVGDHKEDREALKLVLQKLVEPGGAVVDSSPMYGSSEQVVGELSAALGLRPKLFLATKVWTGGRQAGIDQMQTSFRLMKTDFMDLMQVHNLVDVHTHVKTLRQWKEAGKIRYWGLTHYTASAYPQLIQLIKTERPDFVQINYNLLAREAEREILPLALDQGTAILINRPFEEGALFSRVKNKTLPPWAEELGIRSWAQYFLKFILGHPAITCVIPGTSKVHHMADNLQAGWGLMPDERQRKMMVDYVIA